MDNHSIVSQGYATIKLIQFEWHATSAGETSATKTACNNTSGQNIAVMEYQGALTNINLATPICPDTGHTQTTEYQEAIDKHYNKIRSNTTSDSNWKVVNRRISPAYTYGDLKSLLNEIRSGERSAFKINIAFGSMLYHTGILL